jgi:hypothetical protein
MSKPKEFGNQPQQIVQQEATPQTSPEHQPVPAVFDILERGAQLSERAIARERRKFSLKENRAFEQECSAACDQLTDEKTRLYTYGTNSDRLILATLSTLAKSRHPKWFPDDSVSLRIGLLPRDERAFIAKFAPLYGNEDALREELRKAQEELGRMRATQRHREEYRLLPPEEAAQRRQEVNRKSNRRWRQRQKEERQLQAEQQPPTQVFPPPPPSQE